MKTKTVSVRMTTDMYEHLKQLSEQSGMKLSQVIIRLIDRGNVVMVKEGDAIVQLLFDIKLLLRDNPRCDLEQNMEELTKILNHIFDLYCGEENNGDFTNA